MTLSLSNPSDEEINALKALMAAGRLTPDDLQNILVKSNTSVGPSDGQDLLFRNALAPMVNKNVSRSYVPQADFGGVDAGGGFQDIPSGTGVIQDSEGKRIVIAPQGSDPGQGSELQPSQAQNSGAAQRPKGSERDWSRSMVEGPSSGGYLNSHGGGYYGKDGNIYNADGSVSTIMTPQQAAEQRAEQLFNEGRQKFISDQLAAAAGLKEKGAQTEHLQEATRTSKLNNPDFGQQGAAPGAVGPAVLEGVDPGTAGLVKAYAEGRLAFPGGMAMRSPRMMNILQLVSAYVQ